MVANKVRVVVRCRPANVREKSNPKKKAEIVVHCKPKTHEILANQKRYSFDSVFGFFSTQKEVFETSVKPVVEESLAGFNCTVFAYGQTGTGKTHTIQGQLQPVGNELAGIIPRAIDYIFTYLSKKYTEYSVRISYLQLYNEELHDLLVSDSVKNQNSTIGSNKKLRLMDDPKKGGVYCQHLSEINATSAAEVYELLERGVKNRITAETKLNENSSRSHSILTIRLHSKEIGADGQDLIKVGQLNLVDLAGSECVRRSGATKIRAREAGNINQSLLTLGRVITALVDKGQSRHIPYRDSKLTRLLQESLGGKAKTTIIATLSPCYDCLEETLSTLEYATRAKNIENKPEVNERLTKAGLLRDYATEVEMLRSQLIAQRNQTDAVYLPLEQYEKMTRMLENNVEQQEEMEQMLEQRTQTISEQEEKILELVQEIKQQQQSLDHLENEKETLSKSCEAKQNIIEQQKSENIERKKQVREWSAALKKQCKMLEVERSTLADKLNLMQSIHSHNDSHVTTSTQHFRNFHEVLENEFGVFEVQQKIANEKIQSHVQALSKDYQQSSIALRELVNSSRMMVADFEETCLSQIDAMQTRLQQYTDENRKFSETNRVTVIQDQMKHLTSTIKSGLESIENDIFSHNAQRGNLHEKLSTSIATSEEDFMVYFSQQRQDIKAIQQSLNNKLQTYMTELTKQSQLNTNLVHKNSINMSSKLNELKDEMALRLDTLTKEYEEQQNEYLEKLKHNLDLNQRDYTNLADEIRGDFGQNKVDCDAFQTSFLERYKNSIYPKLVELKQDEANSNDILTQKLQSMTNGKLPAFEKEIISATKKTEQVFDEEVLTPYVDREKDQFSKWEEVIRCQNRNQKVQIEQPLAETFEKLENHLICFEKDIETHLCQCTKGNTAWLQSVKIPNSNANQHTTNLDLHFNRNVATPVKKLQSMSIPKLEWLSEQEDDNLKENLDSPSTISTKRQLAELNEEVHVKGHLLPPKKYQRLQDISNRTSNIPKTRSATKAAERSS